MSPHVAKMKNLVFVWPVWLQRNNIFFQLTRNHDGAVIKIKAMHHHLEDLVADTTQILDDFEHLIADGVLGGPVVDGVVYIIN